MKPVFVAVCASASCAAAAGLSLDSRVGSERRFSQRAESLKKAAKHNDFFDLEAFDPSQVVLQTNKHNKQAEEWNEALREAQEEERRQKEQDEQDAEHHSLHKRFWMLLLSLFSLAAKGAMTAADMAMKDAGVKPWEPASGNCAIEIAAELKGPGKGYHCYASASPAGEDAYTSFDYDCEINKVVEYTFPDANDGKDDDDDDDDGKDAGHAGKKKKKRRVKPSVGTIKIAWSEEGDFDNHKNETENVHIIDKVDKRETWKEHDGLDAPQIGFMTLKDPRGMDLWVHAQDDSSRTICKFQRYDGKKNSYKCGAPCKYADENPDAASLVAGGLRKRLYKLLGRPDPLWA